MNTDGNEKKIDLLIKTINDLYPSNRTLIWKSFLKGLFMGLGTTVGVSIFLALITFIVSQLRNDPVMRSVLDFLQVDKFLQRNP